MVNQFYTVDRRNQVVFTATCTMIGSEIRPNPGLQYDTLIADLCRCFVLACDKGDDDAKVPLAAMLHGVTERLLSEK